MTPTRLELGGATLSTDFEGKQTKVLGWKDRDAAHTVIQSSHKRFNNKYASK
jgi:inorganic pyrophosphatase